MAEDGKLVTIEPAALQGLEVVDLVADWNVGEQIDITMLLEQFAAPAVEQADVPVQVELEVADASSSPGDVIVLDLAVHGALTALYDDLPVSSPDII